MIVFFGPAGAGKSIQGQMMAARHGWRWLSAGQLLRETSDPELFKIMKTGDLLPPEIVNRIVFQAIKKAEQSDDVSRVILDGYPRSMDQARGLTEFSQENFGDNGILLIVVLEVTQDEIMRRLAIRGRMEDDRKIIAHRLEIYDAEMADLMSYYQEIGVKVAKINGVGSVGQVHDRIEKALVDNGVLPAEEI